MQKEASALYKIGPGTAGTPVRAADLDPKPGRAGTPVRAALVISLPSGSRRSSTHPTIHLSSAGLCASLVWPSSVLGKRKSFPFPHKASYLFLFQNGKKTAQNSTKENKTAQNEASKSGFLMKAGAPGRRQSPSFPISRFQNKKTWEKNGKKRKKEEKNGNLLS